VNSLKDMQRRRYVGAHAAQMAVDIGIQVVAIAHLDDEDLLRSLGVNPIIDSSTPAFEQDLPPVDAILDTATRQSGRITSRRGKGRYQEDLAVGLISFCDQSTRRENHK